MKKSLLVLSIVFILLIGWVGFYGYGKNRMEVVHPFYGTAVQAAYATGTVEATVMMPISTHITARLLKLYADEGSEVIKGQILAQLEDQYLQETLRELKEREELARKRYERHTPLMQKGVTSKDEYDRMVSEWRAAMAAVHGAEAQVNYLKLIAPADGRIIRRDGEIGQLIPANQAVFWLSCCAPLRIGAEVDEEDIVYVRRGQEVLIRADAFPERIFYGKVQSITPKGDPIARSYRVRISLPEDTPLLIGMTTETNIIFHKKQNALLLPASAVMAGKVWLVDDDKLRQVPVSLGAKSLKQVEILNGLTADDLVILHPRDELKEGTRVRPVLVKLEQ
ncbi:efflux RND transporter periplasmic adaptor subunit [Legionella oakridgensis]|uniref:RND family efflux transporter, MFP subunit n=2 Tax=Legionella oakridgensis TaxID=29423 RepID=W0BBX4_9GAMM|nr:efflux RND transporter periplasmic adaptor subunit [Legionella oakridgensis]AHE65919.1 RND family efflux transporter, MFP subunit [Legionella oakridgensis ATCC 33761 = DSM 21215]ETO94294.1 RND family efflux transporter, MFP subunit [Legionella oakridgensis RV-2-2007]KTD43773.1 membrane fusion protein [Legionella oakridgensis]STY15850.1 Membrane-fusion protein [Legionella longbeachae]